MQSYGSLSGVRGVGGTASGGAPGLPMPQPPPPPSFSGMQSPTCSAAYFAQQPQQANIMRKSPMMPHAPSTGHFSPQAPSPSPMRAQPPAGLFTPVRSPSASGSGIVADGSMTAGGQAHANMQRGFAVRASTPSSPPRMQMSSLPPRHSQSPQLQQQQMQQQSCTLMRPMVMQPSQMSPPYQRPVGGVKLPAQPGQAYGQPFPTPQQQRMPQGDGMPFALSQSHAIPMRAQQRLPEHVTLQANHMAIKRRQEQLQATSAVQLGTEPPTKIAKTAVGARISMPPSELMQQHMQNIESQQAQQPSGQMMDQPVDSLPPPEPQEEQAAIELPAASEPEVQRKEVEPSKATHEPTSAMHDVSLPEEKQTPAPVAPLGANACLPEPRTFSSDEEDFIIVNIAPQIGEGDAIQITLNAKPAESKQDQQPQQTQPALVVQPEQPLQQEQQGHQAERTEDEAASGVSSPPTEHVHEAAAELPVVGEESMMEEMTTASVEPFTEQGAEQEAPAAQEQPIAGQEVPVNQRLEPPPEPQVPGEDGQADSTMTTAIQSEEQPPVTSEATEVDDHTRPVAALNAPQSSVVQRPQVNLPLPTFMDVQGDDMDAQVETGGVEEELKVPMKGDARALVASDMSASFEMVPAQEHEATNEEILFSNTTAAPSSGGGVGFVSASALMAPSVNTAQDHAPFSSMSLQSMTAQMLMLLTRMSSQVPPNVEELHAHKARSDDAAVELQQRLTMAQAQLKGQQATISDLHRRLDAALRQSAQLQSSQRVLQSSFRSDVERIEREKADLVRRIGEHQRQEQRLQRANDELRDALTTVYEAVTPLQLTDNA